MRKGSYCPFYISRKDIFMPLQRKMPGPYSFFRLNILCSFSSLAGSECVVANIRFDRKYVCSLNWYALHASVSH